MGKTLLNAAALFLVIFLAVAGYLVWTKKQHAPTAFSAQTEQAAVKKPLKKRAPAKEKLPVQKPHIEQEPVIRLCAALSKEKTYDDDNAFRFMVAGTDGWIFRTDMDLKQDFELSDWSRSSFARLAQAFSYNGTHLAVMMIPTRGLVGKPHLLPPYTEAYDHRKAKDGYVQILNDLQNAGIVVADTRDVDTVDGFFLKRDNHWTAKGAKYAARRTADAIRALPVYETLRKTNYKTAAVDLEEDDRANDRFLEFIEDVCGKKPPREMLPARYKTSPTDRKISADALLGDNDTPQIVLLGTSNSTQPKPSYANFVGFLKEQLSVDVRNESITGGSFRGSIANYVLTGQYAQTKPKVIIWELSAHYGLDQKQTFREIIPALYGACSDANSVVSTRGDLKPDETVLLDNLEEKNISASGYYLFLALSDKDIRDFKIAFAYNDREEEDAFKVERSAKNFPENNGAFFVELRSAIVESLQSVTIKKGKDKIRGSYNAKICRVPGRDNGTPASTSE